MAFKRTQLPPWEPDSNQDVLAGLTPDHLQEIQAQALRMEKENTLSLSHRRALERARKEIDRLMPFIRENKLEEALRILRAYAGKPTP